MTSYTHSVFKKHY